MTDTVSKKKRSEIMKANKPKGNKSTELKLIQLFKQLGLKGWRRNYKIVGAIPDFVFLKKRIAIFADGCFWHGHNCRNLTPKQNSEYWQKKIENNRIRDKQINERLERKGWKVIRIWECEIKEKNKEKLKLLKKSSVVH
ncbi:MAG: DNA mismatch endonuclease, patch repair protein [Desulfobacteraceae bacterium Eth-SRB1]|nr:MAG: DNA mismatch endonuclease, patch repair protein [Desulfobacteraceae bacterium Eth-SRB1]